jgi:hypothetical protein
MEEINDFFTGPAYLAWLFFFYPFDIVKQFVFELQFFYIN